MAIHDTHEHHGHHPGLQHHFETPEQQKEAASLGMWAFLVTEVMLFGGLFMAYIVYRWAYPEAFAEASHKLNMFLATINTVVLLVSSLTVALAVHAAEVGKRRQVMTMLGVTMVLGVAFLGIKFTEYGEKFSHCWETPVHECLVPGQNFIFPVEYSSGAAITPDVEMRARQAFLANGHSADAEESFVFAEKRGHHIFYLLYFTATGIHAVHMVIGLAVVGTITFMSWRGRFSPQYYTPVEISGLYWHLVDIVWVFLFPLFYLITY